GRKVVALRRIGKRIGFGFGEDFWLVLHLMIAGRLHWGEPGMTFVRRRGQSSLFSPTQTRKKCRTDPEADLKLRGKVGLAAFDFSKGTVLLTGAGTNRRD